MQYIGKKIVRYGDKEFIGDEYRISISEALWSQLLLVATKNELEGILTDALRFEDYETANDVIKAIDSRFGG